MYEPLGAARDPRPRGLLRKSEKDDALDGLALVGSDLVDDAEFERTLDAAATRAAEIVAAMRGGVIKRDPPEDECPRYCTFQSICRRERGATPPEEDEEEEEQ